MNIIYEIAEYIASFVECYTLICLLAMFFKKRFPSRIHTGASLVGCSMVMLITHALNSFSLFSMYTIYIWTIVMFVFSIFLFRANLIKLFCVLVLYLVFLGTFEFFCMAILELIFGVDGFVLTVISTVGLYRTIYILTVKLLIFLICFVISRKNEEYDFSLASGVLLTLYGLLFFSGLQSMVNAMVSEDIVYMRRSVLLALVFVLLFIVSIFVVLRINIKLRKEQLENSIIATSVEILENDNHLLNEAYREISKISHDHINHIQTASLLLRNEKYSELQSYFSELIQDLRKIKIKQYTSVDSIDAVINSKVNQAELHSIPVNVSISYPANAPIRQTDVCAVLMNLIDNAIEACCRIEDISDRYINIGVSAIGEMIIIKVENSYNSNYLISGKENSFTTTKENYKLHGYGIKIVKTIAEKYNGSLEIEHSDTCFTAIAVLTYSD